MKRIDCFVSLASQAEILSREETVASVHLLEQPLTRSASVRAVAKAASAEFTLLYTRQTDLSLVHYALERMLQVADDTGAAMLYADRFISKGGEVVPAPVIDYQQGSLRDDFEFGGLLLLRTSALKGAAVRMTADYAAAGLYDLRLKVSQAGRLEHIGEYLYYEIESDLRKSGEKQFDYVDPKNRQSQIEMEQAVTDHLKAVGGYLAPSFRAVDITEGEFAFEASVVIPCKNRVKTIGDALRSALSQKTDFPYNVIVVDDNSTDGTVDVIKSFLGDPKLVYIAQDPTWHAIGGNWNAAIHHPACGRFALRGGVPRAGLRDGGGLLSDDGLRPESAAAVRDRAPGMDAGERAEQRPADQRPRRPARFLDLAPAPAQFPDHQVRRGLRRRPPHQPRVPDRPRVRRALYLPPLGRKLRQRPLHREGQCEQLLQGPHPHLGASGAHCIEQQVIW